MTISNPLWLDTSELDESIAALDAIAKPEPDILQERINDALYWVEGALRTQSIDFYHASMRASAMQDALARIGAVLVQRELDAGRKYVEPQR